MAKSSFIKGDVKAQIERWITQLYDQSPEIPGKEAHQIVEAQTKDKYHRTVSLSYVQGVLADLREKARRGDFTSPLDSPWSTASLSASVLHPENVPLLIARQLDMQSFQSKPVTIREAKWFDQLSGFMPKFPTRRFPELDENPGLKNDYRARVLLTWAQEYAYREKIDSIAGIKDPDYSDLDQGIIVNDLKFARKYVWNWYTERVVEPSIRIAIKVKDPHRVKHWPGLAVAMARGTESMLLGHGLGTPMEAVGCYQLNLYKLIPCSHEWGYMTILGELVKLRKACLANPEFEITADAKKDGEK